MEINLNYTLWRGVRIFLVCLLMTALFSTVYLVASSLVPAYITIVVGVAFFSLSLLAALVLGSSDKSFRVWNEVQLSSTRELYATLYNQSPVPYLTLNEKGIVTTCNQATARLFQTSIEAIVGTEFKQRLRANDNENSTLVISKLQTDVGMVDAEIAVVTATGEERYVSISVFKNKTFKQSLVSLVDITQHKLVDKAKSEFVALATHQLRTPIAAIRWNVELLERSLKDTVNEKQQLYLTKVSRNVLRMIALINDFLSVSKLENGTFATSAEPIQLKEYLQGIVDEFQQSIVEKQIDLKQQYEPQALTIVADPNLLHIITSNLLSNAVKYVSPQATITFGYQQQENTVIFTVADTGIGIPEHELPQLFTKFFRANNARTHKAEGTGLGLYIVKQSVEKLGGTIEVTSVENQGTTFVVTLPLG